jgi:hypothetical protein
MPLINCPTCKHPVSDQARSCPSCGHPLKKTEYMTQFVTNKMGIVSGKDTLDKYLKEGWQIIDTQHEEEGPDVDGVCWDVMVYKLMR